MVEKVAVTIMFARTSKPLFHGGAIKSNELYPCDLHDDVVYTQALDAFNGNSNISQVFVLSSLPSNATLFYCYHVINQNSANYLISTADDTIKCNFKG